MGCFFVGIPVVSQDSGLVQDPGNSTQIEDVLDVQDGAPREERPEFQVYMRDTIASFLGENCSQEELDIGDNRRV